MARHGRGLVELCQKRRGRRLGDVYGGRVWWDPGRTSVKRRVIGRSDERLGLKVSQGHFRHLGRRVLTNPMTPCGTVRRRGPMGWCQLGGLMVLGEWLCA